MCVFAAFSSTIKRKYELDGRFVFDTDKSSAKRDFAPLTARIDADMSAVASYAYTMRSVEKEAEFRLLFLL